MTHEVIILDRYNGPSGSGNGGWTAGTVASFVDGPAVVTLRRPPPLATPLAVEATGAAIRVYAPDGTAVAEAEPAEVANAGIEPVPYLDAVTLSAEYPGFTAHPFPTCFVCGPDRAPGDGMRLFTGRLGDGRTATPWLVPEEVSPAMVWAALDCPGGWSIGLEARPYVLGRIALQIASAPPPGSRCVVMGQPRSTYGRKAEVATVLYGPDMRPLAWSRATWVAISET